MNGLKFRVKDIRNKIMIEKLIRKFCLLTWRFWEKLGVHVIPNHFYWPVTDSKRIENHDFDMLFPLDGIQLDVEVMRAKIEAFGKYREEYVNIHRESGYSSNGDGAILYSMLRDLKPRKIIEVGSGYSTVIMYNALKKNSDEDEVKGEVISIEPYPRPVLRELVASTEVRLIERKVEDVEESLFSQLNSGDVLFIDTSHVVDIANDVHFLYLRVMPQIPVGVVIHIHDIRFPYEYPKSWVLDGRKHWTEQYLLHMFLAYNESFEVIFASNYLCQTSRSLMAENLYGLSQSGEGWPGSFWIRRIK